jgi:hypothetical protein
LQSRRFADPRPTGTLVSQCIHRVHLGNLNRVAELIQSFKRVTAETVLISAFSTSEACRPA